jgi:hypothetical protein
MLRCGTGFAGRARRSRPGKPASQSGGVEDPRCGTGFDDDAHRSHLSMLTSPPTVPFSAGSLHGLMAMK